MRSVGPISEWGFYLYMVLYIYNHILSSENIMKNTIATKSLYPDNKIVQSLICSTPSDINREVFDTIHPIINEDADNITINIKGVDELVDAKTLKLALNDEELSFMRVLDVTRALDISVESTGMVTLSEAKVIGEKEVQQATVERAQVRVNGVSFNFSAIGDIVSYSAVNSRTLRSDAVSPSSRFSAEAVHNGNRVLVRLPIQYCNEILLMVVKKHKANIEALKPSIREFILEAINETFPHKEGYLNDTEIRALAAKVENADEVSGFDKYTLIAFIQIVVTNYERYKRLYNSVRGDAQGI